MPRFRVTVQQDGYRSGVIIVEAETAEEAEELVETQVDEQELKPGDPQIVWDDWQLEEGSGELFTTGDIEKITTG